MGKKHPYYGENMGINFPDFLHTMSFVEFSCTVGKLWGNPYISHMLKCIIGWELDGKKAPILWEKYEYQLPRLSLYNGFCCIFPYCGKFMGNPCSSHIKTSVNFFLWWCSAVPDKLSCLLIWLFSFTLFPFCSFLNYCIKGCVEMNCLKKLALP